VADALLTALRERPAFRDLRPSDLEPLPATGTAHAHVRLPKGLLARVPYARDNDPGAEARWDAQAEAFQRLAPSGRTPRLHAVLGPRPGLRGGALIVDFIDGHAPRLPGDLEALADTLARIHVLPLPPPGSAMPRQTNPFLETLEDVEQSAARFLDRGVPDHGARAEIAEELREVRALAMTVGARPQPLAVGLADTHPGNFLIDRDGLAWFTDLEKVHVGSPAVDLAHTTLPTSTLWHPDVNTRLTSQDVEDFEASYFARLGEERAAALRPWLMPMRRLIWLRTTLFMARWRLENRALRHEGYPSQWSDPGLDPKMKDHLDRQIDVALGRDFVRSVRDEWLERS